MQALDTGFKSGLGDRARTHVLWAEAVRALQENVDAFHISHCVSMVSVFNPLMVSAGLWRWKGHYVAASAQLYLHASQHLRAS